MSETLKQKVQRLMLEDVKQNGTTDVLCWAIKYHVPQSRVEKWADEVGLEWEPPEED